MEKEILKALYQMRKFQTIQFYKLNKEESGISDSLVFALANDCYPLFHNGDEFDIFNDFLLIKKEDVMRYLQYFDDNYLNNANKTFYEVEKHFGGKSARMDLIVVLRYAFLDNRFTGHDFITKLEEKAPVEALGLNNELDIWEL